MAFVTWAVCVAAIVGILTRPRRIPEWVWACAGAVVLVVLGLVHWPDALAALRRGIDVYLFLIGMMLLAEIARAEGVFDWLSALALQSARGSQERLFALVFAVGVVVTTFLSNDATAVVLTPAIGAVVARARVAPMPYLYACAFVANAASFVLPISNPANLVMYAGHLPALGWWLRAFAFPSLVAVLVTYGMLRLLGRERLRAPFELDATDLPLLSAAGKTGALAVGLGAVGMVAANGLGLPVGFATFVLGLLALAAAAFADRTAPEAVLRGVMWSIVPLVAGLFVIVQALDATGVVALTQGWLAGVAALPVAAGNLIAAIAATAAANVANNLPVAVLAGLAIHAPGVTPPVTHAAVVGVDLGPNLSVSGSLATLLWLVALRRGGIAVTPLRFLSVGAVVLLPALVLTALVVR